jgi:hypothetical protein
VTYNTRHEVHYRVGTASATIALMMVMSGTIAEPAAAQSSAAGKGGWLTQWWPGASTNSSAADMQGSSGYSVHEKTTAGNTAAASKRGSDGKEDPFRFGPQYVGASSVHEKDAADTTADPAASKPKKAGAKEDLFRPGPQYDKSYDAKSQVDVYGAKTVVDPPRPPIEIGRPQYTSGAYDESSTLLGQLNPLLPGLAIYGDWRTAVAYNSNNGKDIAQIATRLNIDVDFKFTGTERIHAFFSPLQKGNAFTRFEFGGGDGNGKFNDEIDLNPQTLFFEGDFGSLYSGFSGREATFDLPFTVGLFPLFLQNGIWANDAILGGAVSIPAKNSRHLGLANFDTTFFAAFDNVDNKAILGSNNNINNNNNANIYGVTTFIDAFSGYIEAGYGLIQGREDRDGQLTNFVTAAYTRRYANTLSNSTRVFANFGNGQDDEGVAILSENSLISGLPSTLIPYANFFVGFGNPQPLVDGNGAGLLKNVGINFETDALTGYPKLNDTGSNAFGGAIGLQYLFNLDQQLLFEVATVQPFGDPIAGIGVATPQYALGVRYQVPLSRAWLFRADATYQITEGADEDTFGIRAEVRRKF